MPLGAKYGGRVAGTPNKSSQELRDAIDGISEARKQGNRTGLQIQIDKLFQLGEGIEVQKTKSDGTTDVYTQAPDQAAIKTILEFRFGKAVQPLTHDVSDEGDGFPVNVVLIPSPDLKKKQPRSKS